MGAAICVDLSDLKMDKASEPDIIELGCGVVMFMIAERRGAMGLAPGSMVGKESPLIGAG